MSYKYKNSSVQCALRHGLTQGDQKVSVHLMITVQSSGAQRLFDYLILYCICGGV